MPENVFIAISGDALHAKSKVYIGRALARKADSDLDEYQLWASLALELLALYIYILHRVFVRLLPKLNLIYIVFSHLQLFE
jgi:hypothetical protein